MVQHRIETGDNHVHIITMGGTIDKDYPRLTSGYAFEFSDESAASRILKGHPNLGISYDITTICKKDSLEISDHDRELLLDKIVQISMLDSSKDDSSINDGRGKPFRKRIVVTHGTDTMIATALYIKEGLERLMPENLNGLSIAFTGATKPERFIDSDAAFNLGSAISVTSHCNELVIICMNGNVLPASECTRKQDGIFQKK